MRINTVLLLGLASVFSWTVSEISWLNILLLSSWICSWSLFASTHHLISSKVCLSVALAYGTVVTVNFHLLLFHWTRCNDLTIAGRTHKYPFKLFLLSLSICMHVIVCLGLSATMCWFCIQSLTDQFRQMYFSICQQLHSINCCLVHELILLARPGHICFDPIRNLNLLLTYWRATHSLHILPERCRNYNKLWINFDLLTICCRLKVHSSLFLHFLLKLLDLRNTAPDIRLWGNLRNLFHVWTHSWFVVQGSDWVWIVITQLRHLTKNWFETCLMHLVLIEMLTA